MNLSEFSNQLADYRSGSSQETPDERLQDDCIRLLSGLDQLLNQFGDESTLKHRIHAIQIGKAILVELIEFVTFRFGTEILTADMPRVQELRDMVREVQSLIHPSLLSRVFGAKEAPEELRRQAYQQVGGEFAHVFRDILSIVDRNFREHDKANEWRSGCQVFIGDFRQRW